MKTTFAKIAHFPFMLLLVIAVPRWAAEAHPIIIDHSCTTISSVPLSYISLAKSTLHIAYGHTSHGSQITTGMDGLVPFMNGLGYPQNLFDYNSGGTDGALDLRDCPFSGASDLGNPDRTQWEAATRDYLSSHSDVNVVMWSWCGQVDGSEEDITTYLTLMSGLERDYPTVQFVYMTGHLNGGGAAGNVNLRNQQIRDYCISNEKILFDFADIESYDPDGLTNYMALFANDNCDYDTNGDESPDANWATAWQEQHTENVDWYDCSAAHSQALNGNRKAYAAWHLWARLAGWAGTTGPTDTSHRPKETAGFILHPNYPNPFNPGTTFRFTMTRPGFVQLKIFDLNGTCVSTVVARDYDIGDHTVEWNAAGCASGIYYSRLQSGRSSQTMKLLLLR